MPQIFFPWNFRNIYSFPCLVSLLGPTANQIIISINIFVSDIIHYEIRYTLKFLIFKFDLKVKMVYRKKLFIEKKNSVDYVKINELHVVHTTSHAI